MVVDLELLLLLTLESIGDVLRLFKFLLDLGLHLFVLDNQLFVELLFLEDSVLKVFHLL